MAIKKPVVLTNGEFELLQAGDVVPSIELIQKLNDNEDPITKGQAVYGKGGKVDLAKADAASTKNVVGFVADDSIDANTVGNILTDGVLVANTDQWDAVTGGANGLTVDAIYYLSAAVAGRITTSPPTTGYIAKVGIALSDTELEIDIEPTIKL